MNDAAGLALVGIVAVAPLPLGSARPFFWAVNAGAVALLGAIYFFWLARGDRALRLPPAPWATILLFAMLLLWLVAQALAPGHWFSSVRSSSGAEIGSAVLSIDAGATWLMLLRWLTFGLLGLLAVQVAANPKRARWLLGAIFCAIAAHAVFGVVALTQLGDPILIFRKWAYEGFATGPFVNRNSFATFLAFGLVLGTALLLRPSASTPGWSYRSGLVLAGLGVIAAALIATQSRMGLAAAIAGLFVTLLLALRGWAMAARLRWAIGAIAILLLAALLALFGGGLFDRLDDAAGDVSIRLTLYGQVLDMIAQRPLLGYGGGTFELAYPLFQQPPIPSDAVWDKAHNTYLTLWSELGVLGGSLPLFLVGIAAICCLRKWQHADDPAPAIAALGVVAVAGVHSLADFSLEIEAVALVFTVVLAIGAARLRRTRYAEEAAQ